MDWSVVRLGSADFRFHSDYLASPVRLDGDRPWRERNGINSRPWRQAGRAGNEKKESSLHLSLSPDENELQELQLVGFTNFRPENGTVYPYSKLSDLFCEKETGGERGEFVAKNGVFEIVTGCTFIHSVL